ncbi:MAG: hypothetical protein NVSMB25_16730 [Thermoleophilaceae bacterium]
MDGAADYADRVLRLLLISIAAFVAAAGIAGIAGAANLGTALGVGQLAFAGTCVVLLLRT